MWYKAPEYILRKSVYSYEVDIWAFGCLVYEIITRETLFPGDCEIDQLFKIYRLLGTPNLQNLPELTQYPAFNCKMPNWPVVDLNFIYSNPKQLKDLYGSCGYYSKLD